MSYISFYQDNKRNKLLVSERINGQRFTQEFPLILEYYIPDKDGYFMGYDGQRLKKINYSSAYEVKKIKNECAEKGIKTYELSFNLPNKVLYQQYNNQPAPELHKSFIDIEVDRNGYEYLTVKELVDKACCPINAISIYNNWQDTLYTLMLCPETLKFEEAQEICNKFDNTFLFKDEKDLLEGIIALLNDCDVATGWNSCLRSDSSIWLSNKIIDINKLTENTELVDSKVLKKSDINIKDEYCLSLVNGQKLYASNEHIFPIISVPKDKYTNLYSKNSINALHLDMKVEDIILEKEKNNEIFFKVLKHKNINKNLTYRDYMLSCLDYILNNFDPCFTNMNIKIDWKKSRIKQKCYSKIKDKISKEEIINYINTNDYIKIFNLGTSGSFIIDLNKEINKDYLHLLGLIYTDGSKYQKVIVFYNSNKAVIDKVTTYFDRLKKVNLKKTNPYYNHKGVMRRRICMNNEFGFLLGMIYENDKKNMNLEALSLLSNEQFMEFFSGCIDGDGWVEQEGTIGFCNYNDNIKTIQELLLWNGIISFQSSEEKRIIINKYQNIYLKSSLNLWVDYKLDRLNKLKDVEKKNTKAKANQMKFREDEEYFYIKLKNIEKTNNNVEMLDIMTDTHYFYTQGVKTHNCRFDYPYIVRRIENVLGENESKRLCLWGILPKEKQKENNFGSIDLIYEFYGKWFADYMELYQKHERGKKESYKLNSIAELELGEEKVQHTESLEDMYRYNYEDFIRYNRQDTMLVKKLEDKLKYIDTHNEQAHEICCSLEQTMGTVGWVDQAIINESHKQGYIVPDKIEGKNPEFEGIIPAGAYCADPINKGLVNWIFSFDMSSLYPSTSMTLNLSPETIVAQVQFTLTKPYLWNKIEENKLWKNVSKRIPDWGAAWGGLWATLEYEEIMNKTDTLLTLKLETGEMVNLTAKEIYNMVFSENSNLCISAAGTIYRTDKQGLYAGILAKWFAERKSIKKEMFRQESMETGVLIEDDNLFNELMKEIRI